MGDDRHRLDAAGSLRPLQQGQLSCLCGLYAHLNAIQLALFPDHLTRSELRQLYGCGVEHLARSRLLKGAVGGGMTEKTWRALGDALLNCVNEQRGTAFKFETPTNSALSRRRTALRFISTHIQQGRPVLIGVGGALDHFTVVAGCSSERLTLFDSSGHRWILAKNVGLSGRQQYRHELWPQALFALIDDW